MEPNGRTCTPESAHRGRLARLINQQLRRIANNSTVKMPDLNDKYANVKLVRSYITRFSDRRHHFCASVATPVGSWWHSFKCTGLLLLQILKFWVVRTKLSKKMLFGHLTAYSHQNDLCEAIMCMFRISMHQISMRTCITTHVVQ